jgi:AcrR family transcriptional regulator
MSDITDEKKIKILGAARQLFARFGFRKTSIEEIAREAGIGKGTLYLYFSNKEQIFTTVLMDFGETIARDLELAAIGEASPDQKLKSYILAKTVQIHRLVNEYGVNTAAFEEAMELPMTKEVRLKFQQQQMLPLIQIITEGVEQGLFCCKNIKVAAMALFVAIDTLSQPWICEGHEIDLDAKIETLLALFLRGLMKRE